MPTLKVRHLVIISSFVIRASSFMNPRHQRNPWWFCHWCPFVVVPVRTCARPFSTFVTNLI